MSYFCWMIFWCCFQLDSAYPFSDSIQNGEWFEGLGLSQRCAFDSLKTKRLTVPLSHQLLPIFLCLMLTFSHVYPTGLYENYPTNAEPECCDVRWGLLSDHQSKGTIKTSGSTMCHRTSLTVSSASRLCNSRLKLCVLVLILLHTVLTVSAAQNSTGLGFGGITTLEDNSTNEE